VGGLRLGFQGHGYGQGLHLEGPLQGRHQAGATITFRTTGPLPPGVTIRLEGRFLFLFPSAAPGAGAVSTRERTCPVRMDKGVNE
jgi:hypothetical protein